MPTRETAAEIDSVAADWAARLDRGDLSPAENTELEAWLAGDSRRAGAFARARAVALYSERARALGPNFNPATFGTPKKQVSRRELLWSGGAIAAGLGALAVTAVAWSTRGKAYLTQVGEMKIVPLADGSVVSLNTHSKIKVAFSDARRAVLLDEGEALFDVAKDAARPFVVLAGETVVTAVGTSFIVRRLAGAPVQVLVREGIVDVRQRSQPTAHALRLPANMRAVAAQDHAVAAAAVAPAEIERATAWRDGRIAFEGDTLRQAAAEFARYSDTRIVINDPKIADEQITGLFQANDPVGFARATAISFGLRAEISEKQVRIFR